MSKEKRGNIILEHLNNALHAKAQRGGFSTFKKYVRNVRALAPGEVRDEIDEMQRDLREQLDDKKREIVEEHIDDDIESASTEVPRKTRGAVRQFWEDYLEGMIDILDRKDYIPK